MLKCYFWLDGQDEKLKKQLSISVVQIDILKIYKNVTFCLEF